MTNLIFLTNRSKLRILFSLLVALLALGNHPLWAADQGSSSPKDDVAPSAAVNSSDEIQTREPQFPFQSPQVGPLIKQFYPSDVERRTTAFIPLSTAQLSQLTPIIMPSGEDRWIRVDLSEQIAVAYEGVRPLRAFIISSGLPDSPTVTGRFRIRVKVPSQTMSGGSGSLYYYLPNVQWVQYFYEDYGFHGTYWHNDFGRPHSHGCINMTNADAQWLFDWAGPEWDGSDWQKISNTNDGTLVIVHD